MVSGTCFTARCDYNNHYIDSLRLLHIGGYIPRYIQRYNQRFIQVTEHWLLIMSIFAIVGVTLYTLEVPKTVTNNHGFYLTTHTKLLHVQQIIIYRDFSENLTYYRLLLSIKARSRIWWIILTVRHTLVVASEYLRRAIWNWLQPPLSFNRGLNAE